jgi:hypothetical protein
MPDLPQTISFPPETRAWSHRFANIWNLMIQTLNALSRVDTAANKPTTPDLDHIFFTASDTDRTYVAVAGVWKEVGRLGGTEGGATQFIEIADPAAPAANNAVLYAKDNGAGKTQLAVRFNTGAVQILATEP